MPMTSCNLLLASFGASSSAVRFHPLGVLSNGMTQPVSIMYANARSGPKQTHRIFVCVMGLTAIRGLLIFACRDSIVMRLHSLSWDTSKRRPSSRATDLPALHSGFRVPVTFLSSRCWMPCHSTVLHAAVSIANLICVHLLSDQTPTARPIDLML